MWGSGPWLATGLLGLALVLGTGTPATATGTGTGTVGQQPVLSLSLDGQHWAATLERPLFDSDKLWVPGDSETVSVWVRNLGAGEVALDLWVKPYDASWSTAELDLSARVDGQPVMTGVATAGRRIEPKRDLTRVDLTATMSKRVPDRVQQQRTPFLMQLRLTEVGGAEPDLASTSVPALLPGLSEPVGGHLPGTGAPPFGVPLTLVALVVAARAAVLARRSHLTKEVTSCMHR